MSRKLAGVGFMLLVVYPLLVSAQTNDICSVSRTLSRGMSGDDVTILQTFLANQSFFNRTPTGYFGPLTEAALANWQLDRGIISSITDGGVYGPKSRAYGKEHFCSAQTMPAQSTYQSEPTQQCPTPPILPTNLSCSAEWKKIYDANNCHAGWSCVVYMSTQGTTQSQPPIITAIQGPTTRKVNESGTWTITAKNFTTSALAYSIIWGECSCLRFPP